MWCYVMHKPDTCDVMLCDIRCYVMWHLVLCYVACGIMLCSMWSYVGGYVVLRYGTCGVMLCSM